MSFVPNFLVLLATLCITMPACAAQKMDQRREQEFYQVAVIGGGPSGLSCANKCEKFGFSTIVVDEGLAKTVQSAFPVQNWPGMQGSSWSQIIESLKDEFKKSGGMLLEGKAINITQREGRFYVATDSGTFSCEVVVIATGKKPASLTCVITPKMPTRILMRFFNTDFLKEKDTVSIIGDDEQAIRTAQDVAVVAQKVFLFYRFENAPSLEALQAMPNVKLIKYDQIVAVANQTNTCRIEYTKARSKLIQSSSWVIFSDLLRPRSGIAENLVKIDSKGAVVTFDVAGSTNTPGLYSCGEVAVEEFLPGIAAAASGVRTGAKICRQLIEDGVVPEHHTVQPTIESGTGAQASMK